MRALRQIRADAFANDLEITDAAVTAASSEASRVSDCVRDVYSYPAVCSSGDVYSYPAVCTSDDVYSQHAHYVASAASSSAAASSSTTAAAADVASAAEPLDLSDDAGSAVTSLLKPVTLTMVLVVFLVHEMKRASMQIDGGFSGLMVYQESADDSAGTIVSGVLLNGVVVVLMLAAVTTGLLILYKCRCYLIIYAWLFLSVTSLLVGFGGYVAREILMMHDVPLDAPSFYLVLYNYAAVGTLLIFWTEYGCGPSPPLSLQQAYLIFISALLAWSASKLPEWTTWGLLASIAVWDLIAVLTPRGPLKLLVEEAEARGEPIPGLVYQGADSAPPTKPRATQPRWLGAG